MECNDCGWLWRWLRENIHKLLAERSAMGILVSLHQKLANVFCIFATEEGPIGAKTACFIEQVYHVIHT